MTVSISIASALHKAKIASTSPWYVLLSLSPAPEAVLRLARAPEDVTFQGTTWVAFNFDFDAITDASTGQLTTLTLRVCNVNRLVQSYLEQYDGGIGATVHLRVVSAEDLHSDPSIYMEFVVTECSADSEWATFTLGADNPMRQIFPSKLYLKDSCIWRYNTPAMQAAHDAKGAQCGYTGGLATCNKTLTDCRAHANSARFGGFPGIDSAGFRVASII